MRWPGVIGVLICVGAPAMAQDSTRDTVGAIVGLAIALACIAFYFLPAIIGGKRRINASGALFFVNLLFGWTVLGWFLCLIWAASGATRAQDAFFEQAVSHPGADPTDDAVYREAYAKERARLDHEAARKERGRTG